MKKTIFILILAINLLNSFSCAKKIDYTDREFIGSWMGRYSNTVDIKSNGRGSCNKSSFSENTNVTNGRVKINDGKLLFKVLGNTVTFVIDKRPYKNSTGTKTEMVLDGEVFVKD